MPMHQSANDLCRDTRCEMEEWKIYDYLVSVCNILFLNVNQVSQVFAVIRMSTGLIENYIFLNILFFPFSFFDPELFSVLTNVRV